MELGEVNDMHAVESIQACEESNVKKFGTFFFNLNFKNQFIQF